MVLFVKCYVVFHCLMFYFQQVWVKELPPFLEKSCQLCLPSVHFVAAKLYFSVFSFGVGD